MMSMVKEMTRVLQLWHYNKYTILLFCLIINKIITNILVEYFSTIEDCIMLII